MLKAGFRRRIQEINSASALVRISVKATPSRAFCVTCLTLLGTGFLVASTYTFKFVVDGIAEHKDTTTAIGASCFAVAMAASGILQAIAFSQRANYADEVGLRIDREVMDLASSYPYLNRFDDPNYGDHLESVRQARGQIPFGVDYLLIVLNVFARVAITTVVMSLVAPIFLLLPLLGIPALILGGIGSRIESRAAANSTKLTKEANAIFNCLMSPQAAKELMVFRPRSVLEDHERTLRLRARRTRSLAAVRSVPLTISGWTLFGWMYLAGAGYVVWLYSQNRASVGDTFIVLILASQLMGQLTTFASSVKGMIQFLSAAEDLQWIRRYREEPAGFPIGDRKAESRASGKVGAGCGGGLYIDQVDFMYPSSRELAIRNIALSAKPGTIIAIVGKNGAGKSTLVNCIMGMYTRVNGTVILDGHDMLDSAPDRARAMCSAAFQDYVKFEVSLQESVGVGDIGNVQSEDRVIKSLRSAGIGDLSDSLPNGLSQNIGSVRPGAINLSGGQWQRIALARANMRDEPNLLVLDEPTGSLDPLAERELVQKYRRRASEALGEACIVLFVTHRLVNASIADEILYLDHGVVVERGTHGDLLELGGQYSADYSRQAAPYRD